MHSRVNLVHFKVVQLDPYETYMMKLTCCTRDCLLEHGVHSRHVTQIGIYFILRNNWHIDVPWNISKIFYWIPFLSVQHRVSILNCMIFCTVFYANFTYCELVYLIGTYIMQGFDMKLEIVEQSLDFHLGSWKRFDEVENVSDFFFIWLIQDFVLKFWNLHYFLLLERCIYSFF